jgi:hypothetical protein
VYKRQGERKLRRQVVGRSFAGLAITPQHAMWNNGITAVCADRFALFDRATELLDAMHAAGIDNYYLAQLTLSLAMTEHDQPQIAEPWFHHYWANKDGWGEAIAQLLADARLTGRSAREVADALRTAPIDRPISAKLRGWQRWMVRLARLPPT